MITIVKDIIKGFFFAYLKFWLILFVIIFFFVFRGFKKYYTGTNSITLNRKDVTYVGTGVAVNKKYILTNLDLIENSCNFPYRGTKIFFAVDKNKLYTIRIHSSDKISNMVLMTLDRYGENLSSYSVLQSNKEEYNRNKKLILPKTLNSAGNFIFKNARVLGNDIKGFFITSKNRLSNENLSGSPIFNENLILQGIIKEKNPMHLDYKKVASRDKILDKTKIHSIYFVNNTDIIKNFLNKHFIEYYVAPNDTNLKKSSNPKIKDSIINIICIKEREFR